MSKLEEDYEEKIIMFQSGSQSPKIPRKQSPNKITGWGDQETQFVQQIINNKLKNTTGTFRIKPSRPIYDKLTIQKEFIAKKQNSLGIQPAIITKLKQELKYLESPKKKPTKNNLPKVTIEPRKPFNQQQVNFKINSLINSPDSPLKTTRLLRNTLVDKRTIKSQRGTPSKRKFFQQQPEDHDLTLFKEKILNMVNRHTAPLQMTIHNNGAYSNLRNKKKNISPHKHDDQLDSYLKIQQFKIPIVPLYKILISERQTQQNGKKLENKIIMSRVT